MAERPQGRFLKALKREPVDRPPLWMMRQAGRYLPEYRAVRTKADGFLNLCYTPELAAEVTLQPLRRFPLDAAILFADILLIPHALGQKVWFEEGEGPRLDPITDTAGLASLDQRRVQDHMAPVYETVSRVRSALDADTALIGFAGAPWTVATYMVAGRGTPTQADARGWAYRDPETFRALIDAITEATIGYLSAQVKAGADAIQLFDTWAGGLPEDQLRLWAFEPAAQITAALKQMHPGLPVIGFPRGIGSLAPAYIEATGVDGIGIDTGMAPAYARDHLQPLATVQGNLDPLVLVAGGAALETSARAMLNALSGGPYIANLGHGIVPQTPPEHVARFCEIVTGEQVVDRSPAQAVEA